MNAADTVFVPEVAATSPLLRTCLEAGSAENLRFLLARWSVHDLKLVKRQLRQYFLDASRHLEETLNQTESPDARSAVDLLRRQRKWRRALATVCIEIEDEIDHALNAREIK